MTFGTIFLTLITIGALWLTPLLLGLSGYISSVIRPAWLAIVLFVVLAFLVLGLDAWLIKSTVDGWIVALRH